jgi:metallo-beta-lactamase class B
MIMLAKYEFSVEAYENFYRYPDLYRIDPLCIFGNLYYVGNKDVSSHLIDTGDGLILIDTTYPTTEALLLQSVWQAGFNPKDIVYILHTHGHFDHFGATRLLTALSGAKTFLGARDAKMFRERPEMTLVNHSKYSYLEPFVPDVELSGGEVISRGNTSIRVVATPGHTDGVMSYFFKVNDGKTDLTAGLHGGVGLNTLNRRFIAQYGNDHSRGEYLESLAHVRGERVDITLGNHVAQNRTIEKRTAMIENPAGPNPFIDPGEWQSFIGSLEKRFNQMLEDEKTNGDDTDG